MRERKWCVRASKRWEIFFRFALDIRLRAEHFVVLCVRAEQKMRMKNARKKK